jgi:tRNA nucleotidyltransferase (CCA-adding enzyme)
MNVLNIDLQVWLVEPDNRGMQVAQLPEVIRKTCHALSLAGGRPYLVGGCVRDLLLGSLPKDWDIELYGLELAAAEMALQPLGQIQMVGKAFGVIKLKLGGHELDIALPRNEIKTAPGHQGFAVTSEPGLSPELASARRDFTINAIMLEPESGDILDFHGGRQDLSARRLRHVSPAFAEDPLRVLRGMQFAARFDLTMDPETTRLCASLLPEAHTLPAARIWGEWRKWLHAPFPSRGLQVLEASAWLTLYPELAALKGCAQDPRWHPEGDVWTHTGHVVDMAAKVAGRHRWHGRQRERLLLAALCHDLGKPDCTMHSPGEGIRSAGHPRAGVPLAEALLGRIHVPAHLKSFVLPLVAEHLNHMHGQPSQRAVRRLAVRLEPADIVLWEALVEADASGRPPLPPSRPAKSWLDMAEALNTSRQKPSPLVSGHMLMAHGMKPGKAMGALLQQAYEAQLDGAFDSETGAEAWVRTHRGKEMDWMPK